MWLSLNLATAQAVQVVWAASTIHPPGQFLQPVTVPVAEYVPASQALFTVGDWLFARGHSTPPGQSPHAGAVPPPAGVHRPLLHGEHVVCELSYWPASHRVQAVAGVTASTTQPPVQGPLHAVMVPVVDAE